MYSRLLYSDLKEHLPEKEFTILIGARQVGKTHLIKSLYQELRESRYDCFYLTFEDASVLSAVNNDVKNIFRYMSEIPPMNHDKKLETPVYLFIDEIQLAKDPSNLLKYLYDTYAGNLKVVATGSSAFYIDTKFKDSLAGRKKIFRLYTLSFYEFLLFNNRDDLADEYKMIKKRKDYISQHLTELTHLLSSYLVYGGYPAVVLEANLEHKIDRLRELTQSYLKKDILESGIDKESVFYNLLKLLASQIGNLLNKHELSNTLGVDIKTIDRYAMILQKCFHVELIRPYYKNIRSELTKMPKLYFNDLGFRNSILNNFQDLHNRLDQGQIVENYVYQVLRDQHYLENINYWRLANGGEVDFVIEEQNDQGYALEVKYDASNIKKSKYKRFVKEYPQFPLSFVGMPTSRDMHEDGLNVLQL